MNPQNTRKFRLGECVKKTKGANWHGHVVGFYSTQQTPEGYVVESITETGSVQLYPAAALEACGLDAHRLPAIDGPDLVAEKLDEIADLGEHWKRNRERGHTSAALRTALLIVADEIRLIRGLDRDLADPFGELRVPVDEHLNPKTAMALAQFSFALGQKLRAAERKYGFNGDWLNPDWMDECRAKLLEHLAKGDPRDVAAYCMFLWWHGEKTAAPAPCGPCVNLQQKNKELRKEFVETVDLYADLVDRLDWVQPRVEGEHIAITAQRMVEQRDARIAELEAKYAEHEQAFDLRWNADRRAIERWRAETGKELTMPDHVDLCVWLLEKLTAAETENARLAQEHEAAGGDGRKGVPWSGAADVWMEFSDEAKRVWFTQTTLALGELLARQKVSKALITQCRIVLETWRGSSLAEPSLSLCLRKTDDALAGIKEYERG